MEHLDGVLSDMWRRHHVTGAPLLTAEVSNDFFVEFSCTSNWTILPEYQGDEQLTGPVHLDAKACDEVILCPRV